jgi:hypothetical protein
MTVPNHDEPAPDTGFTSTSWRDLVISGHDDNRYATWEVVTDDGI